MELVCTKYNNKVKEFDAVCAHPGEYCKFRTSCIINFLSKEKTPPASHREITEETMNTLQFTKGNGLLPAIVQDHETGEVLMLAYVNEEAWAATLATGKAHYWSRSRNTLWLKGESSGHVQIVKEILVDCDEDTVIYKVEQLGNAACHKGYRSCFFRKVAGKEFIIKDEPLFDPKKVYTK